MSLPKAALLALCVVLPGAPGDALAQSQSDYWGKPADFKPLLPPIIPPPLLPPRSTLTPGSGGGDTPSSYSTNPAWDAARSAPAPGLRFSIPTR
jgi:hypothetical protein